MFHGLSSPSLWLTCLQGPSDLAVLVLEVHFQDSCPCGDPLLASHCTRIEGFISVLLPPTPYLLATPASSRILPLAPSSLTSATPCNWQASFLHFFHRIFWSFLSWPLSREASLSSSQGLFSWLFSSMGHCSSPPQSYLNQPVTVHLLPYLPPPNPNWKHHTSRGQVWP